jgi:hypothetical protein
MTATGGTTRKLSLGERLARMLTATIVFLGQVPQREFPLG